MAESETTDTEPLRVLLRRFVSGEEQSQAFVRDEIGALLEERFPEGRGFSSRELYEELEVAVACYRPGGGEFMYDEEQAATVFAYVLHRLEAA